jgi:drug/metabolite transporter (DMT)-like permease
MSQRPSVPRPDRYKANLSGLQKPGDQRSRLFTALCYLTLYVVWGSTYFFIKMAVTTIPPTYVLALRFAIGGPLLLAIAYWQRRQGRRVDRHGAPPQVRALPTWQQLLGSIGLGTLLLLVGNGLITVAEQVVDSYLVALVLASTPMVVAFFDRVLLRTRISALRLVGILIGVLGVAFLLYSGGPIATAIPPQILMVIGGVTAWGLATSLGHTVKTYPDPLVNSGIQMLWVAMVCMAWALLRGPALGDVLASVSTRSGFGVLYLGIVGTLAFAAYTYLIAHEPAIRVSSYALINPLIATMLGLLVGDETPVPFLPLGLPLILIGVAMMLYGERALALVRKRLAQSGASAE